MNLKLPFAGNFIQGQTILPEIIKRFEPLTVLGSTVGGHTEFSGILNKLISIEGNQDKLSNNLPSKTDFINPVPGRPYKLKTYKFNM